MKRGLIALGIVMVAGVLGVAGYFLIATNRSARGGQHGPRSARAGDDDDGRPRIRALKAHIPDVPLPEGVPYLDLEGEHEDGYPSQTADGEALIALLHAGEYARLTSAFATYLAQYRANPKFEYVLLDALTAIAPADLTIGRALDEWVEASPNSFAAYAARGEWHVSLASAYRGDDFVFETSNAEMRAMRREVGRAWEDLERAAVLASDASPVLIGWFRPARMTSDHARFESARTRAERDCQSCIAWRGTVISYLEPKWGGSFETMLALEQSALTHVPENQRLAMLRGRTAYIRADYEARDRPATERLAIFNRQVGESTYWIHSLRRAQLLAQTEDFDALLIEARKVLAQSPNHVPARSYELQALWGLDRWDEAVESAIHLARLAPSNERLHRFLDGAVSKFPNLAYERLAFGDVPGAERFMGHTRRLAPESEQLASLGPHFDADRVRTPAIVSAVDASPDDFEAVRAYDAFFFERGQYEAIATRWTTYLERKPDDARAYAERCGTYSRLHRWEDASRDCAAACRLRNEASCPTAERLHANALRSAAQTERERAE